MDVPYQLLSTDNTITVEWTELTGAQTGNSDILSYNLYWNDGSGDLTIELCDSLRTSFTVTSLIGSTTYSFKVRAFNIYGYGEFSDVYQVVASDLPGKPVIPTVSLSGTDVIVSWVEPAPHSAEIDSYQILFKKADDSWVENLVSCDGAQSTIVD